MSSSRAFEPSLLQHERCNQCMRLSLALSRSLSQILQFELSGRFGPEPELPKRLDGPELLRVKQKPPGAAAALTL